MGDGLASMLNINSWSFDNFLILYVAVHWDEVILFYILHVSYSYEIIWEML